MKLIVAGSRYLKRAKFSFVAECISVFSIEGVKEIVSGGASGVDEAGAIYGTQNNIPVKYFWPNWTLHRRAAGPIRNQEMAEYADQLLLIWDGKSAGSAHMKEQMLKRNKPIFEVIVKWSE